MKQGICYIVGAGENYGLDFTVGAGDFVIAADGGYDYLKESGIAVDLVIGDFDSSKQERGQRRTPTKPEERTQGLSEEVIALSPEKDDTDTLAAVREGLARGYEVFHIYCGTGGRIDHTLANIQVLAFLSQQGKRGYLFARDEIITAITNDKIVFPCSAEDVGRRAVLSATTPLCLTVSVFAFSEKARGVRLQGLKYSAEGIDLDNTFPIGVSNELIGAQGSVEVAEGTVVVVFPRLEVKGGVKGSDRNELFPL